MTKRAVIADDDTDIRSLVRIAVARAGLELVADVADGDAAWSAIQEHKPDLVVLDVAMPGLTGIEICQLVRSTEELREMKVLLLSAAVDDASRERGMQAGATDYIPKPFSPRDLVAVLSRAVEGVL
jgi:DNA-binding response OmpR family regulator